MKHIVFAAAFLLASCASEKPLQERAPSSIPAEEFQTSNDDAKFDALVSTLDLNAPEMKYEYKSSGTSLGFKIETAEDKVGKWLPTNAAANPEAQVVSYWLARFLFMSELVVPSAYYTVQGRALEEFKNMLKNAREKNSLRLENQQALLATLEKNPDSLWGSFTSPIKNFEAIGVANAAANTINSSHPMAQFIRADGPLPSAEKQVAIKGVKVKGGKIPLNSELNLARELSRVMVLDLLTGQWDRFSGGNLEATYDKKTNQVHFLFRDNGGASMAGNASTKKYLGIVSRFDRAQISRVQRLRDLLAEDAEGVAKSLQMKSKPLSLVNRVAALLEQVKILEEKFGAEKVYFAE